MGGLRLGGGVVDGRALGYKWQPRIQSAEGVRGMDASPLRPIERQLRWAGFWGRGWTEQGLQEICLSPKRWGFLHIPAVAHFWLGRQWTTFAWFFSILKVC